MHRILFTASTFSHIRTFHLPYLRAFRALGWEVDVACGGTPPDLDAPLQVDRERFSLKAAIKQFVEEENAEWRQFKELLRSLRKK